MLNGKEENLKYLIEDDLYLLCNAVLDDKWKLPKDIKLFLFDKMNASEPDFVGDGFYVTDYSFDELQSVMKQVVPLIKSDRHLCSQDYIKVPLENIEAIMGKSETETMKIKEQDLNCMSSFQNLDNVGFAEFLDELQQSSFFKKLMH